MSKIYRSEFPSDARAQVETARLAAYAVLERAVQGLDGRGREASFVRCVLSIFLAFAREASEFAKHNNRRAWSGRELDQRCREFLLEVFIDAYEDRGKGLGIRKMFRSTHGYGYSLDEDAERRVEKSPEWIQYEELLRDAVETQSHRGRDPNLPQPEAPILLAPETGATLSGQQAVQPELAEGEKIKAIAAEVTRRRQHGCAADMKRHRAIAEAVEQRSPSWRNSSRHWRRDSLLSAICSDLDQNGVSTPKNWRSGKSTKNVKLTSWAEAWDLGYKKRVIDQIGYSLEMVLGKTAVRDETLNTRPKSP